MNFKSDNAAPAHPDVMAAVVRANEGYAASYGEDDIMDGVRDRIREIFEAPEAAVYLVGTGTTANVLSLAIYAEPWHTIYCHREAHIEVDECGGPEFYTGGAKLKLLDGLDAKYSAQTLRDGIAATSEGFVHSVQRGVVSITNGTESGALYTVDEVTAIGAVCAEFGLPLHMDGARFANALVAADCTPAEMTWKAGVNVLCFGGTKNGLMGVEAVVIFDPEKAWEFELRRKRGGHLYSKHRYLSAQMAAYLEGDLWLKLAAQANAQAEKLAAGILAIPGTSLCQTREINGVFASFSRATHKRAIVGGAKYYFWPEGADMDGPDDEILSARLMCSWYTTDAEIDGFLDLVRG